MRVSRRRVLQIGGLAPLGAVLLTGHATSAEVGALAKPLPTSVKDGLLKKAKKHKPDIKDEDFNTVATILVDYFATAASDYGAAIPDDKMDLVFVDTAYEQKNSHGDKSGDLITDRIAGWESWSHKTVACAYNCGAEFAIARPEYDKPETVTWAYQKAYEIIEHEMGILLVRARKGGQGGPGGAGC